MADILEEFDFSPYSFRGVHAKYPWTEWMDGQIWKLKQGVDFQVKTSSLLGGVRSHAKRKGLRVKTARFGEYVVIQAIKESK